MDNYNAVDPQDPETSVGAGYWGLAPLNTGDEQLREAGIEETIAGIAPIPVEAHEKPVPLTGVLITTFYWGKTLDVANFLVAARVKDAVRIDGNSSILLGRGSEIIVGQHMIDPKRYYNRWGYQFQKT